MHEVTFVSANTENREAIARTVNAINREAEDKAREHRLNLDRVVHTALLYLVSESVTNYPESTELQDAYLSGATGVYDESVRALVEEVRKGLSPVVR